MNISKHNRERLAEIREEIRDDGVVKVAARYDVNFYYTSMLKKHAHYCPRNSTVCTKLGLMVYRVSVPHGAPRPASKRFTVYPGTDPMKIKAGMKAVTGVEWVPLTDVMEY